MCNCLETVLVEISEKLKPTKKVLDFKAFWKGGVIRFDGGCGVGLYVQTEHRNIKVDGTPYAKLTNNESFVAMSFCPFCGESMTKKDKE